MTTHIEVLEEPSLQFRHSQACVDPKGGLALFGPYDSAAPASPGNLVYGLVGTPAGLRAFRAFATRLAEPIISVEFRDPNDQTNERYLWPPFPGFDAAFQVGWGAPAWEAEIEEAALLAAAHLGDPFQRAFETADLFLQNIRIAAERDEALGAIICVVPDEVWRYCRPLSRPPLGVRSPTAETLRRRKIQPDLFGQYQPETYDLSRDFRRQLKARSMESGIPLQIVRESTLRLGQRQNRSQPSLSPLSDRAWNLGTTLYYKAGGRPWRLSTARDGVCYVGIAFRRAGENGTACCAAQMFLDTGDGVVFRGEFGPWYSEHRREFHLDRSSARQLLQGVLRAYEEQGGVPLQEVFLHSRSGIDHDEFAGYCEAVPSGVSVVGIRVRKEQHGFRGFRPGRFPLLRGTWWRASERTAYLWSAGFKPSLLTYDGWETPIPLRIDIQHGDASVRQVTQDILGLTKLNYNACRLGDSLPVTIKFSDMVGEILISNPSVQATRRNFKFYI